MKQTDEDDPSNLEDIYYFERSRSNPAPRIDREKRKAKRSSLVAERPVSSNVYMSTGKRKVASQLATGRRPDQPATKSDMARQGAKRILESFSEQDVRRAKELASDIFRRSAQQPVRMDQFDNKRSYDDMIDKYEAKERNARPRTFGRNLSGFQPVIPRVVAA